MFSADLNPGKINACKSVKAVITDSLFGKELISERLTPPKEL